jgi:glycosyltransferase involved in cell wall biosynthesis
LDNADFNTPAARNKVTVLPDSRLPMVSVVIAAYNYEQYVGEAIESALNQSYPHERLAIVVVDDGSTDATAAVVTRYAERHPGVVRLIQQVNSGPEAAVGRGMAESSGELIAFLDADDAWMPGKLRGQVAVLQERPEVGLVFGDMLPVGGDGRALDRPLILHAMPRLNRRAGAQLLAGNVASTSAIVARREVISRMPPRIPIADWWFTLESALKAEIAWINTPVVNYRIHGSGRSAGRQGLGGIPKLGPFQRDVQFKLEALRILDLERFTPAEMVTIWEGLEGSAGTILQTSGTHFSNLTALVDRDPERATEFVSTADLAHRDGDAATEARMMLKALAWDPYLLGGRRRLYEVVRLAETSYRGRDPLASARRVVVLSDAEELLADEAMLDAYAEAMAGVADTTLAIDATRMSEDVAASELRALVTRRGLAERDDLDLLAVLGKLDEVQHHRLHNRTTAYFRRPLQTPHAVSASSEFTTRTLGALRGLVDQLRSSA